MILTIDIGNSNSKIGVFDGDNIVFTNSFETRKNATYHEHHYNIKMIMQQNNINCKLEGGIISSVAPSVTGGIVSAIKPFVEGDVIIVSPQTRAGLEIKLKSTINLGADLICGAVCAINEYKLPCIVIDMGTATTLSAIDEEGALLGTAIAPGVKSGLYGLVEKTSCLPEIGIKKPPQIIATDTVSAMLSGAIYGAACMIDGMVERFKQQMDADPTVIVTGGMSHSVICHCKNNYIIDQNLVLKGLNYIYSNNML